MLALLQARKEDYFSERMSCVRDVIDSTYDISETFPHQSEEQVDAKKKPKLHLSRDTSISMWPIGATVGTAKGQKLYMLQEVVETNVV